MSKLLIVESPTKERTIGKMLGKEFVIRSSFGHIRDLPARELGVNIKGGFGNRKSVLIALGYRFGKPRQL